MKIGLLLTSGYFNEFEGWDPGRAWTRTLEIARLAEALGFESVWTGEHLTAKWSDSAIAFDCWTLATAVAAAVPRVRIGLSVMNSTYRNPALMAKMASTLDAISGGRLILGLGAGFREAPARQYGFDYPGLSERLRILEEHFEIVSRLTRRGEPPFTFSGSYARVEDVTNAPATGGADHIPLSIGGHGKRITFRICARYCDELDLNVPVDEVPEYLEALGERCTEIGRDADTILLQWGLNPSFAYAGLRVLGGQRMMGPQDLPTVLSDDSLSDLPPRSELIERHRALGFGRLVAGVPGLHDTDEPIYELLEDLATAGIRLEPGAGDDSR